MSNKKGNINKILLPLASLFLVVQSYKLLHNIHYLTLSSFLAIFFTAWVINMYITGIFALTGFAYPTQKLLPTSYYRVRNPEMLQWLSKLMRIDWFRQFLLATVWRNKKQRKKYFNGQKNGIENLVEQSMKSEFGHLLPFIILTIISIYFISINLGALARWTMIWNLLGNFYPIILQRHHRMRIQRIREARRISS